MKRIALLSLAIASTLHADTPLSLSQDNIQTLTPIDTLPSTAALARTFMGTDPLGKLEDIALSKDPALDLGVQLRAIRSLPMYCALCDRTSVPYTTLATLLEPENQPSAPTSHDVLRLRATIEAFGALKSPETDNYTFLLPFLNNTSRDIRAATALALGQFCNDPSEPISQALIMRSVAENAPGGSQQVEIAISAALRDLAGCATAPH